MTARMTSNASKVRYAGPDSASLGGSVVGFHTVRRGTVRNCRVSNDGRPVETLWTRLPGPVLTLEVDAQARLWGRLVVVLLAGVCFLWGDVGLGEHLERMAGRRQPDRLGKVGAEVVSPSQRYGKR
jgi:hypothetical protein